MAKKIPYQIRRAASEMTDMFGDRVKYLGIFKERSAYYFALPEDVDVGFPEVYLFDGHSAETLTGYEALAIIGLFVKD